MAKILISAYACRPGRGSEPGVGWMLAREVSKHHDVWVLTREENRAEIEAGIADAHPNTRFAYYDLPSPLGSLAKKSLNVHYHLWQNMAARKARQLHEVIGGFDLAHHVTYVRYWSPSFCATLGIPFVWGPVGGGERMPDAFQAELHARGKSSERFRTLAQTLGEMTPSVKRTARNATLARATTPDSAARLRALGATNVEVCPEAALPSIELDRLGAIESSLGAGEPVPVRFISMGRLLHWKGFHLGIRAFAAANLAGAEYWILGSGPEREILGDLAKSLGVESQVKFVNNLPRNEALGKLADSMALVHPSLHDSGGWVCLEAMSVGKPVICLDLGGPGVQVTENTGIKVAANSPEQAVRDLAIAMTRIATDADLRARLGVGGRKRVRESFMWETRGQELAQLYDRLIGGELPPVTGDSSGPTRREELLATSGRDV